MLEQKGNAVLNAFLALRGLPWKLIGLAALGLALVSALAALKMERLHSAKLSAQIAACSEARKADRAAYEAAQAKAAQQNLEHVSRKENQQKVANNEATRNLNAHLEQLRRELRSNAAPQGHPGSPKVPQAGDPPGTPDSPGVYLTPEEHLRAAEDETRHAELVALVEQLIRITNEE